MRPVTTQPIVPAAWFLWALLVLTQTSCLETKSTRCSWGHICPEGTICDPVGRTCIHPSQERICRGLPDGDACEPEHALEGELYLCVTGICRRSVCGDGVRDTRPEIDEQCDDGNTEAGDGCRADCRGLEHCPDGLLDVAAGEICDDGNLDNNDQCTIFCQHIACGDGLLSGIEECDDGTALHSDTEPDACRMSCHLPACEDDVVDSPDARLCWSPRDSIWVESSQVAIGTADFNTDGRDDLLVWSTNGGFTVLLSQGDGGWTMAPGSPHTTQGNVAIAHLTVADINNDNLPDVVAAVQDDPLLQIFLGDAAGNLTFTTTAGSGAPDLNHVTVGDFTGDGHVDLAAMADSSCSVLLFQGSGDGNFGNYGWAQVTTGHCWATGMHAADLNADGHTDLVVATGEEGVHVLAGNGTLSLDSGAVYSGPTYADSSVRDLAVADVNNDGRPDILYAEQHPPETPLRVLLNQGSFEFAQAPGSPVLLGLASLRIDVGDFDENSTVDLVATDYVAAAVFLVMGAGDGTFTVQVPPAGGMALSADDVVFGHFYDSTFGGLAMLKISSTQIFQWAFEP